MIGSDSRSFLAVVRSLGRQGHNIHSVSHIQNAPAFRSKYITKHHLIVPVYLDQKVWLEAVQNIIAREQVDYIIPCTDDSLLPLLHGQHSISDKTILHAGLKAFDLFRDKTQTRILAKKMAIPVTAAWGCEEPIVDFPVYLKPRSSVMMTDLQARRSVVLCEGSEELQQALNSIEDYDNYFIEQHFDGVGVGVSVLAKDGEVKVAFQHQRVIEGVAGGSSIRKSVAVHPDMLVAVRKLSQASGLDGVAMFEFRYNPKKKAFILLEVNARFWGSLPLAIDCGVDFPSLFLQQKALGRDVVQESYQHDKVAVALHPVVYDIKRLLSGYGAVQRIRYCLRGMLHAIKGIATGRLSVDSFDRRDHRPFQSELSEAATVVISKAFKSLGIYAPYVQWQQRRKFTKLAKCEKSIGSLLIICSGNICRSPFLAEYLRQYARGLNRPLHIESAGFLVPIDRPCPEKAIQVAQEFVIDLSSHQSSYCNRHQIENADVILYFDAKNKYNLQQTYPEYMAKAVAVGVFLDQFTDIQDPFGGNQDDFYRVYSQVKSAADRLLHILTTEG